ncbi:alcohol dehydrogenase catalytic domain-containing protein [Kribbella qitaiheensis]|uniref:alcohol dehydrogenase catalytic domain-containing protein n=1 Tax=Kribbella qitaiheensis TaxID=1544730 RepID=UPI001FE55BF4|nr:alcohol dehydrogenase catalytic domain-containing protein [Kribbella qitaiheensis]
METNETMRALVQQSHHGPGDLILTDVRRPEPGPGEYLVRVGAAGVNFADVMQTHGSYGGGPKPPYAAGFEAAGEIVRVGPEVEHTFPIGTHVIGAGPGAFAEYVVLPAGRRASGAVGLERCRGPRSGAELGDRVSSTEAPGRTRAR